jgi:hypothetical protein
MFYNIIPGTTSKQIDNEIINDSNVKEGNESFYIYPQDLYTRLLISKQDLKFSKPDNMGEETYKYEWLRTYIIILSQLLVELGSMCSCPKITAGTDWEFLCTMHGGKNGKECCAIDYCVHNLDSFQNILSDRTYYPDRSNIVGKCALAFPQMLKNIHRIIAYTYYSHKILFDKYEKKYCLNKRYLLFPKKYNVFDKKHIVIK